MYLAPTTYPQQFQNTRSLAEPNEEAKPQMGNPYTSYSTRTTPQAMKIPGREVEQVKNAAGGFVFQIDDWARLHRFLIIGSDGGTFYVGEQALTRENADCVLRCIKEDGPRAVSIIVQISTEGRAPKQDPAIFALAMCAGLGDDPTRRAALHALPEVCRIGTHLFHFATFVQQFRGWGRGLRSAVARWYEEKDVDDLALQLVKYRQRDGWSHRDLMRLSHPIGPDLGHTALYDWTTKIATHGKLAEAPSGSPMMDDMLDRVPATIIGFEKAQGSETPAMTARIVRAYQLPREALKTEHLISPEVWEAMLENGMLLTALVRNLATMTRIGLLTNMSATTSTVVERLLDTENLRKARVHPISLLIALKTYASGQSVRGSSTWAPVPRVIDALDEAFYLSFGNVQSTGKRRLIALDVSGSMGHQQIAGIPGLSAREASAAMAMVTMRTGDPYEVVAFTGDGRYAESTAIQRIGLSARQRLDDVVRTVSGLPFGATDCALPMLWAQHEGIAFDAIEVYTDNETWRGAIHPSQALEQYRQATGLNTKLIVASMTATDATITPRDIHSLDVAGFDSATPAVMSAFIEGGF